MRNILFLIMALIFQSHYDLLQAQTNDDKIVIQLDDPTENNTSTTQKKKKTSYLKQADKNIIKTGLLSFIYGEIPFYYERYIRDFFTIQVGAGLTTRSFYADFDYLLQSGERAHYASSLEYGINNWTGVDEYDEPENYHDYQYRKASIGPYISITPKFYFGGEAPDGFYLAPHFSYAIHYFKVPNVNEQGYWDSGLGNFKESIKNKYVGLILGEQSVYDHITLDMFVSGGLNFKQENRQDIGYYYKETDEVNYEYKYINRSLNYKKMRPYLRINFILGFVWGKSKI